MTNPFFLGLSATYRLQSGSGLEYSRRALLLLLGASISKRVNTLRERVGHWRLVARHYGDVANDITGPV